MNIPTNTVESVNTTTLVAKAGPSVKTQVKVGLTAGNHNQTAAKAGLPVKTQVKAGRLTLNHNHTIARVHDPASSC